MKDIELRQSLEARGLRFQLDGEALNVRPQKLITDEVRQIIRDHKDALIATLQQRDASAQRKPLSPDQSTPTREATSTPQDIARLDAERNERDRKNRRGYDYDGRSRTVIKASEHVDLVIDTGEFGNCEVCGDPAGIVLPWNAAVNGKRHFCGGACWNKAKADASGDGR